MTKKDILELQTVCAAYSMAYSLNELLDEIHSDLPEMIGIGKGNEDWNCSGPHGAGRLMSRSKAKDSIAMDDFKHSMEGIFTTSVNESTLDESPMAYKPAEEIIELVKDTIDIIEVVRPIYNFKASE